MALSVLASPAPAAGGSGAQRPAFRARCVSVHDSTGAPRVEISVEIPPGELSFVRSDSGGYQAEVDVAVTLFDREGEQVGGDVWRRIAHVRRYADLLSDEPVVREHRTLAARAGKLKVHVQVQDINADRSSGRDLDLDVEAVAAGGDASLQMGDLVIGTLEDSLGPPRREAIHASDARVFGDPLPRLACYGEILLEGAGPDSVEIRFDVNDETGSTVESGRTVVHAHGTRAGYLLRPHFERLGVGAYTVRVQARWGRQKARREQRFEMDESRIVYDQHFDETLDMLSMVAERSELDSLRNASSTERPAMWDRFWARHNPAATGRVNPAAREFFRRIRYANLHFSTPATGPGWRSDMGRVYIKYGPPDRTETHPPSGTEFSTELWFYSDPRPMTFAFVDRNGFGRFELVSQRGTD